MKNCLKEKNGITLIALVITIIVLLILAGVSISLVMGQNGILTQAKNAVEKNQTSTAEEEISMAWASCESDYWSAWANNSSLSKKDFFEGNNGNKGIAGYLSELGEASNLVYNENGTSTIKYKSKTSTKTESDSFTITNGKVKLDSSNSGGNSVALSTVTKDNYGDYIDLEQSIVGTSATTDDWRILYNDTTNNIVYAILADYLPNSNAAVGAAGLDTHSTYVVYLKGFDATLLLAGLNHTTAWNSLIPSTLVSRGASVKGAVTGEILMASYNAKHGTSLNYIDRPVLYSDPTNSSGIDNLYVPSSSTSEGLSFWLASPYQSQRSWYVEC